jgi:hypothetical protein
LLRIASLKPAKWMTSLPSINFNVNTLPLRITQSRLLIWSGSANVRVRTSNRNIEWEAFNLLDHRTTRLKSVFADENEGLTTTAGLCPAHGSKCNQTWPASETWFVMLPLLFLLAHLNQLQHANFWSYASRWATHMRFYKPFRWCCHLLREYQHNYKPKWATVIPTEIRTVTHCRPFHVCAQDKIPIAYPIKIRYRRKYSASILITLNCTRSTRIRNNTLNLKKQSVCHLYGNFHNIFISIPKKLIPTNINTSHEAR